MSKLKSIQLVKGDRTRFVNAKEYSLIKNDMNGWEVKKDAPAVPQEVAQRIETTGLLQPIPAPEQPAQTVTTSKPKQTRKSSKQ